MSLPTAYTIGNLQNDAVALAKAVKDALTAALERDRQQAWIDVVINSAKVVSGTAYLAANDPKWGGMVGSASTLAALGVSADHIRDAVQSSAGIDSVKIADILGVVGGISDFAGDFLVKPGPQLAAGLILKGVGLATGVAQNIVGDDTVGNWNGNTPVVAQVKAATENLFPGLPDTTRLAPDGVTPLDMALSTVEGNLRRDTVWTQSANGSCIKTESIVQIGAGGVPGSDCRKLRDTDNDALEGGDGAFKQIGATLHKKYSIPTKQISANDLNWRSRA